MIKILKISSILLFCFFILLLFLLIKEKKENEPYKREAEIIKELVLKSQKEIDKIEIEKLYLSHPLSLEKERKDKLGESFEDEKIIFVSDEIFKEIELFKNKPE
ncbi:MAG: hypothetical protein C4348_02605 [Patescibacteria group bacterium]